jgi:hypothetical protein
MAPTLQEIRARGWKLYKTAKPKPQSPFMRCWLCDRKTMSAKTGYCYLCERDFMKGRP